MIDVTVKHLAAEIQISVNRLLKQFTNAGIFKSENDIVTHKEKKILLAYLNHEHGNNQCPNKLTLLRKTKSTLNIPITGGKSRSIKIEFRKKYTYVNDNIEIKPIAENNSIKIDNKQPIDDLHKHQAKSKQKKQSKTLLINDIKDISSHNKKTVNSNNNKNVQIIQLNNTNLEVNVVEMKRKAEETARLKLEKEAQLALENARRLAKEKAYEWAQIEEEDKIDYHTTTSIHARQAEDENDLQLESGHIRIRNSKILRLAKKNNKQSETKKDFEDSHITTRNYKNSKQRNKINTLQQVFNKPIQTINRDVIIGETITVAELSNKMAVKSSLVIKTMMKLGLMITINQTVDQETAQLIAEEMGHKVILRRENELETAIMDDRDKGCSQEIRAPIVTIMGHVDHGKTSLLDHIRSTKITDKEAGGITQHIGAYHVKINNNMITFLDTPGHAAFTAMRSRGVKITDIVILVVAVDDGVMPQTIEAIQHAQAAKVPVIVAINKIDKTDYDSSRIKNELTKYNIVPEEWGGENIFVNISAKHGIGIEELLNAILLQAELLELKVTSKGMGSGVVIESFLDKGRGPIATVLVKEGQLNKGDIVLCGFKYGRIRAMRNEFRHEIIKAGPSIPVEILGLSGLPIAGDEVTVVRDEKKAREVALYRQNKYREIKLTRQQNAKLENMFTNMTQGTVSELNIILKADVQGSVEAISDALNKLSNNDIKIKIIVSGVGGITETDASLAAASNAIILGFNVRADVSAKYIIDNENLDIRYYSIIYNLLDDITAAMKGMLKSEHKQKIIGLASVRDVFKSPKFGSIAGCIVTEGNIKKNNPVRILRNNIVIYEGELESLRRFKEDVNEVRNGIECGIGIKNYNDIIIGDIIEVFETVEIKRIKNQL
ncbi:MAG: translation initiation factor IF-2 [Pantoea sp. Brub]|nr:translation initiation factor IF-2 [Pantoea sp. Brub]